MSGRLPRLAASALAAALWALCGASSALAQDPLAAARAHLDHARFAEAVEAFDRAADGDGLARREVLALLEGRALARHARREVAEARADLRLLLALEPGVELGRAAPPALRRLFEEVRAEGVEPLGLDVQTLPLSDGLEIRIALQGPTELVRRARVVEHRDGRSVAYEGRRVLLRGRGPFRFHVEVVGIGGAVLASAGSPERPMQEGSLARSELLLDEEPADEERGDDALWAWLLGGSGALLVIGGVIAVVLAATLPSGRTQPTVPMPVDGP
jgi:hypothetical protein